jgi:hypothetical protein
MISTYVEVDRYRIRVQPSISTVIKFDGSRIHTKEHIMSDAHTHSGLSNDPAMTRTSGCCGNASQSTVTLPEPAAASAAPCCGTATDATAEGACCGTAAKADAVAAGQGCC